MNGKRIFEEGISLLPLIRAEKIEEIIYKFDGAFLNSLVSRTDFKDVLNKIKNNAFVFGAYCDNKIVGFSALYINDFNNNIAYITLIAVDKQYQGMHIGSFMMQYIKDIAKINKFVSVKLEVDNENFNAIQFYKRNGFQFDSIASENSKYMIFHF